jgi:hypothetical protein
MREIFMSGMFTPEEIAAQLTRIEHEQNEKDENVPGDDDLRGMSAVPPIAPKLVRCSDSTKSAMSGLMQCSKQHSYSITSSAVICMINGTASPSALAVLRLMTNSNFTVCWTGRSAGFSPLRIRPA